MNLHCRLCDLYFESNITLCPTCGSDGYDIETAEQADINKLRNLEAERFEEDKIIERE